MTEPRPCPRAMHISQSRQRRGSLMPPSNVPKVLLHDNCSQQQLLNLTLGNLTDQERRARRHHDLRRRTFITTQSLKQEQLNARGIQHVTLVPMAVASAYSKITRFYRDQVRRLPTTVQQTSQTDVCVRSHMVDTDETGYDAKQYHNKEVSSSRITNAEGKTFIDRGLIGNRCGLGEQIGISIKGARGSLGVSYKKETNANIRFTENRLAPVGIRKSHTFLSSYRTNKDPSPDSKSREKLNFPSMPQRSQTAFRRKQIPTFTTRVQHLPAQTHTHPTTTPIQTRQQRNVRTASHLIGDPRFTRLRQLLASPDPAHYANDLLTLSDGGIDVMHAHHNLGARYIERSQTTMSGQVEHEKPVRRSHFKVELNDSDTSLHFSSGSEEDDDAVSKD